MNKRIDYAQKRTNANVKIWKKKHQRKFITKITHILLFKENNTRIPLKCTQIRKTASGPVAFPLPTETILKCIKQVNDYV